MTVGIIGAGAIGSAVARLLSRAKVPTLLSNSRGPETLQELASDIGGPVKAVTREQAAAQPIVLVAVPWSKLPAALSGLPNLQGRIVLDANNPIEAPLFERIHTNGRLSTEVFSELVPGARVVKAFNHLRPSSLSGAPLLGGGQRNLFLAGNDDAARAEVSNLMARLGFRPIDLGSLSDGGRMTEFPGGPLANLDFATLASEADPEKEPDYDELLRANLDRVFNERDSSQRLAAVRELFTADPIMYEPAGIVRGQAEIAAVAGKLLEQFGPTFRFTPTRSAVGHHGIGSLPWHAGPQGGAVTVRGSDIAEIRNGKISRLWVMLESE